MPFVPYFSNPLTDLSAGLVTREDSHCANFELKLINCLEAYGMRRGEEKCADLIHDLNECVCRTKQNKRVKEMRKERFAQIKNGQLSKEEAFLPGPTDSYPY